MTDKEFCIKLIRRLQKVDDICSICVNNPIDNYCTNSEVGDMEICYNGMKEFEEMKDERLQIERD